LVYDPRKNALLKVGNKNDRIDARKLAELLRANLLSSVFHEDTGLRAVKELARSYLTMTKDLTRVMVRLKALYRSWAIPCATKQVYAPRHRAEWLAKIREASVHRRAEIYYQQLDALRSLQQQVKKDVTLLDTWKAMESLVDHGKCRAIGLSDITLNELRPIYESARIKPAVVQVEAHPYLPETELLEFCKRKGIVFLAFAPLGHGVRPGPLEDPVISAIAAQVAKTPAQVLLAWAVQRGTALLTTPRTAAWAQENFNISALPEDALEEINRIQTRQRLNDVVKTGIPGFIPQGSRT